MDARSFVEVHVSSNFNSFECVRRFSSDISISELKKKLELLTGASSKTMQIQLLDKNRKVIVQVLEDDEDLKFYPVENDMFLHVIDLSCQVGEFEDVSSVVKFQLSEEEYKTRKDTFRAFKEKLKISNKNDDGKIPAGNLIKNIHVGDRCEVRVANQLPRKATVRFVGETAFKPGYWVGVEYDEPVGKNDGSFQNKRYFDCQPNYGGFIRPKDVFVEEFPPVNLNEEI